MKKEKLNFSACDFCGKKAFKTYGKLSRVFNLMNNNLAVKCLNCGLYQCAFKRLEEYNESIYNENYHSERFELYKKQFERIFKNKVNEIKNILFENSAEKNEKINLLEIGSAYGLFINEALKEGWECGGVELSKQAVETAELKFGIKLINKDFEKFEVKENHYDAVFSSHCLEHSSSPALFIKKIHASLKKGGIAYIIVPNEISGLQAKINLLFSRIYPKPSPHLFFFQKETLRKFLETNGFEIIFIRTERNRFFETQSALSKSGRGIFYFFEKIFNAGPEIAAAARKK